MYCVLVLREAQIVAFIFKRSFEKRSFEKRSFEGA